MANSGVANTALQALGTHWHGSRAATFRVHSRRRDWHHGLITTGVQVAQKTGRGALWSGHHGTIIGWKDRKLL